MRHDPANNPRRCSHTSAGIVAYGTIAEMSARTVGPAFHRLLSATSTTVEPGQAPFTYEGFIERADHEIAWAFRGLALIDRYAPLG